MSFTGGLGGKSRKKVRLAAIVNNRFLVLLLKVIIHGDINANGLGAVQSLLGMIDTRSYLNDPEIHCLLETISIVCRCKMSRMVDNSTILSMIETGLKNEDNESILTGVIEPVVLGFVQLHDTEIDYVLKTVSTYVRIGFILEYKDKLFNTFTAIETGSSSGIDKTVEEFETTITDIHLKLHKSYKTDTENSEPVIVTDKDFLKNKFQEVFKLSKRKTKFLKLGIKKLNEMISGVGIITGKFYLFNAPINSFKSSILLYMIKWIKKYNSAKYMEKYKKTGKKPMVVFVSLENTWDENTERLFSMFSYKDMCDLEELSDAENTWSAKVMSSEDDIIDICMIYGRPNKYSSVDLEYDLDLLESKGYDVIGVGIDYLKVMRDVYGNVDPRLRVISISTDLHEIAARRPDTAIFSAHHTGRSGDEAMTEITNRGGIDKVKVLGRQHLTEANGVEDPIDMSFYMGLEVSPFTGETYLTLKKGKCRFKRTPVEYFAYPLIDRFFIEDDVDLDIEKSVDSMADTAPKQDVSSKPIHSADNNTKMGNKGKTSIRNSNNQVFKVDLDGVFDDVA